MKVDNEYLEKCITKGLTEDKHFGVLVTRIFKPEFFQVDVVSEFFKFAKNYIEEYNRLPPREIFVNSVSDKFKERVKEFFDETENLELDVGTNYDWLLENTNEYLKDRAIKDAITKSVDAVEGGEDSETIRKLYEEALAKDLKIDLGLDYFGQIKERLTKIFTESEKRIPTCFPTLDEYISGGLKPYTLSVFAAGTHQFKSNVMANSAARQVERGYNVCIFSFEMSETMYAQRMDSIYTKLDINRMYTNKSLQKSLMQNLKEMKSKENRGELYIKEFPTGSVKINDLRTYLKELSLRNVYPDIIYCDYLNLMGSSSGKKDQNSYEKGKEIAEDLRALSLEFNAPVVTATQINREGGFIPLQEINENYISESIAIASTCDFLAVLGVKDDKLVYESEIHYKLVKNRLGGMIGTIDKLFVDKKSLKMYDKEELDLWFEEARISGDTRKSKT